jgi:hypothetical protein
VLIVLAVLVVLVVVLWAIVQFLFGVLYTETPPSLLWRTPAAAAVIWFAALVWPLIFSALTGAHWPVTFEGFSPSAADTSETFPKFIVEKEPGRTTEYRRVSPTGAGLGNYQDAAGGRIPDSTPVVIGVDKGGRHYRFEIVKDRDGYIDRSGGTTKYTSPQGDIIPAGEMGQVPGTGGGGGSTFLAVFAVIWLWAAWFVPLWLLVRFQLGHAVLIALLAVPVWYFVLGFVL